MSTPSNGLSAKLLQVYMANTTTSMLNNSQQKLASTLGISLPFIVFLALIGLVANLLICYIIFKKNELHTPTFYLMINMSVSHCLALVVSCCIIGLDYYLSSNPGISPLLIAFCKAFYCINCTSYIVSTSTLTVISIERYLTILSASPLRNTLLNTSLKLKITIAFTWIIGILMGWPNLIMVNILPRHPWVCNIGFVGAHFNLPYFISLLILAFIIPSLIIGILYFKIVLFLRGKLINHQASHHNNVSFLRSRKRHLNTIKMLTFVTCGFMITCMPIFITSLVIAWNAKNSVDFYISIGYTNTMVMQLGFLFLIFSFIINPLIYLYYNQSIRSSLPALFCQRCRKPVITVSLDNTSYNSKPTKVITVTSFNNFVVKNTSHATL